MEINKFSEVNILCSFVLLALIAYLSLKINPAGWASTHYVAQALLSLQTCFHAKLKIPALLLGAV